jgi:low affinity Fe/Cu permease
VQKLVWHLDKRVSVSHLITTILVIISVVAWSFQLQNKIDNNNREIQRNAGDIQSLRADMNSQYGEILRRLERIQEQQGRHLERHADE